MENPYTVVDWIVSHRMYREKKVVDAISEVSIASLDELLNIVYDDVDKNLLAIAKYSLLAHLNKLIEDERVEIKEENYYWKG